MMSLLFTENSIILFNIKSAVNLLGNNNGNGSIIHEATPLEKRPKKLTGSWRLPDSR